MPLYLDVHAKIEGSTADVAADAHRKDLEIQQKHGVKYLFSRGDKDGGGTTGSTRARARCSVWWRRQAGRRRKPCTAKRTA